MDIAAGNTGTAQDTRSHNKIRRTRSDWLSLVKAWECSNQTQQAFCQGQALCYRQFSRWKSHFKNEAPELAATESARFVPVKIHSTAFASADSAIQVNLSNGIQVSLFNEAQVPVAAALIKQLAEPPC